MLTLRLVRKNAKQSRISFGSRALERITRFVKAARDACWLKPFTLIIGACSKENSVSRRSYRLIAGLQFLRNDFGDVA
jgi:hypothetical protein